MTTKAKAQNEEVKALVQILGIDVGKLDALMDANISEVNLNEYGRFDELKETIDKPKAKAYFEVTTGENLSLAKVNIKAASLLRLFILEGGFKIDVPDGGELASLGDEENEESGSENSPSIQFQEHQLVSLAKSIPAEGLMQGISGTIVHLYANGLAYEVEFVSETGSKVVTLLLNQIKPSK